MIALLATARSVRGAEIPGELPWDGVLVGKALPPTSFPGSSLYLLEVKRGPWERGCTARAPINVNFMARNTLRSFLRSTNTAF